MKKLILVGLTLCTLPSLAAMAPYEKAVSKGKVTFYKDSSTTAEQFSAVAYNFKPDQAWLDKAAPLTKEMRQALTTEDFKTLTQEEIDQIYIRLDSGPIQPGAYKGSVVIKGTAANNLKKFLLKKFKGAQIFGKAFCGQQDIGECFAELAWKGKRIYAPTSGTNEYLVRNAVAKLPAHALKAVMVPLVKQVDPSNWLIKTKEDFFGESKYMIFPAHLYCGQSLLDHRRESVIIDYSWGSDFTPFIQGFDDLLGRNYMNIRDEIRMVRPGLYLGRAYAQKVFLFNFVLYNPEAEKSAAQEAQWPADSCFNGKSTR